MTIFTLSKAVQRKICVKSSTSFSRAHGEIPELPCEAYNTRFTEFDDLREILNDAFVLISPEISIFVKL